MPELQSCELRGGGSIARLGGRELTLLCGSNQYTLLQNRDNSGLLGTPLYCSLKLGGGDAPPMLKLGGQPPPPAPPVEPPLELQIQQNLKPKIKPVKLSTKMHLIDHGKALFLVQIHNTSLKFVPTVNFQPNSNKMFHMNNS